jgi:hypothetical protein
VGLQTEKRNSYADFKIKKRQALWNVIGLSVVAITVVGNAAGFGEQPNRWVITADWEADSGNDSYYTLIKL